jgi:alkylation response protein AidB-like acyl-CoA dehydrogenase
MHLAFDEEENAFREEIRSLLRKELPPDWRGFLHSEEGFQIARRFCRVLAERGWLTMAWPRAYGGAEASLWKQTIFREEMWANGEPRGPQYMSLNYIGPAIMKFGSEEQKRFFLPKIAAGEIQFCQGFSEPDAGTDLASLKTRAIRDGEEYVINGEKIWTSYAQHADYCYLLARTDPEAPKHRGLSLFLVPMTTPGITVRPIRSMDGYTDHINHVFFDNVRVPVTARLGEENHGWYIATSSLNLERIGVARWAHAKHLLTRLVEIIGKPLPDGRRLADEPWVRQKVADLETRYRAARLLNYRVIAQIERGEEPTWEASLARLHSVLLDQQVAAVALEILGHYGLVLGGDEANIGGGLFEEMWRKSIPATIAAGTLEIQKNLIATRGLGLPRVQG